MKVGTNNSVKRLLSDIKGFVENALKNIQFATSSQRGGVICGSDITDVSGYNACPIVDGVPYFRYPKFKTFRIQGTTDMYGKIDWSGGSDYHPITCLSRSFLITGDKYGIRVINVDTDTAVLYKNKSVDFYAIGLKIDADSDGFL